MEEESAQVEWRESQQKRQRPIRKWWASPSARGGRLAGSVPVILCEVMGNCKDGIAVVIVGAFLFQSL